MIGDLNLPQCRKYRVEQLDEIWGAADIGYSYAHYEDIPRAINILQCATHLMLYRLGSSPLAEMYLYEARRLKIPVIYDIDDPLFSFPAYENYSNGQALPENLRRSLIDQSPNYFSVMQQADALTLSTPGLVDAAERLTTRPTYLRRNFADRETLRYGRNIFRPQKNDDTFEIIFSSGSQGHEIDLLEIVAELEAFLSKPNRQLKIIGRFDKTHLTQAVIEKTKFVPFIDYSSYLRELAKADCALIPLVDDEFNRCKSAVRVIDAASVAVPSVVGSVGDAPTMVKSGRTGVVAKSGEWFDGLEKLARDPEATSGIGRRARVELEET
ncbi:MAG: glycosyltransferase, partial [Pseudomonadota bacterium]